MTAFSETSYITASDPATNVYFGTSVAMGVNYCVVGAPRDDEVAGDAGAAYVFERTSGGWVEQQKLTASDGAVSDYFGQAVAILDDNTIAVGAYGAGTGGAFYIFTRSGSSWTQRTRVNAPSTPYGTYDFAKSLAFSDQGDLIVGAPAHRAASLTITGGAFIYTGSAASWALEGTLEADDAAAGDEYGTGVSLWGDTAVVGSYKDDDGGSGTGSIYVSKRSGGSWSQDQKLVASDPVAGDYLGFSVSIYENTIAAGSHPNDGAKGACYIFTRSGDGGSFSQAQKIVASDAEYNATFGYSVSVYGTYLAVGAKDMGASEGALYLYEYNESTLQWDELEEHAGNPAVDEWFGNAVSLFENSCIAGAYYNNVGAYSNAGAAYVFAGPPWEGDTTEIELTPTCEGSYTHLITDGGDLQTDDAGRLWRDCTVVESKAKFLIFLHRGEWWANPDLGSRIHTIQTLRQAEDHFESYVNEALNPLIRSNEITGIRMGEIEVNNDTGFFGAQVYIDVPYLGEVSLGLIPIGEL